MLLPGYHHFFWYLRKNNSPVLLAQCGFNNCNLLQPRFNALSSTLHTNPKGKFVTRVVQMGTEPLFDDVITPQALTTQVNNAKANLSDIGVQVTVSELAYGYQERNASGSQAVLDAIDVINAHMLPFFAGDATRGVCLVFLILKLALLPPSSPSRDTI
jgi:exo-beta-1,3-glucanase (GH17 family)